MDERFHGCLSSSDNTESTSSSPKEEITCRRCIAATKSGVSDGIIAPQEEKKELLNAIVLKNVLSNEECRELIEGVEKRTDRGYSFWSSDDINREHNSNEINDSKSSSTSMFRNSDTVEVRSKRNCGKFMETPEKVHLGRRARHRRSSVTRERFGR